MPELVAVALYLVVGKGVQWFILTLKWNKCMGVKTRQGVA
jgi:hypothetical protein